MVLWDAANAIAKRTNCATALLCSPSDTTLLPELILRGATPIPGQVANVVLRNSVALIAGFLAWL
jgi:hypothetical protein